MDYLKIILLLSLSSCEHTTVVPNSDWANVHGAVNQEMVDYAIQVVEDRFFEDKGTEINLDEFNSIYPVHLFYVPHIEGDARGKTNFFGEFAFIRVTNHEEIDAAYCVELYYVLAHELLHYVAPFFSATVEENKSHSFENYFMNEPGDISKTLEFRVYFDIRYACEDTWGPMYQEE